MVDQQPGMVEGIVPFPIVGLPHLKQRLQIIAIQINGSIELATNIQVHRSKVRYSEVGRLSIRFSDTEGNSNGEKVKILSPPMTKRRIS